eukprot:SAG31_NODE_749_length_12378_cov_8.688818_2_plen_104_part_00
MGWAGTVSGSPVWAGPAGSRRRKGHHKAQGCTGLHARQGSAGHCHWRMAMGTPLASARCRCRENKLDRLRNFHNNCPYYFKNMDTDVYIPVYIRRLSTIKYIY